MSRGSHLCLHELCFKFWPYIECRFIQGAKDLEYVDKNTQAAFSPFPVVWSNASKICVDLNVYFGSLPQRNLEKVATNESFTRSILHHYHNTVTAHFTDRCNGNATSKHNQGIQSMQNPNLTVLCMCLVLKRVQKLHAMQAWCCQGLTGHWLSPYCTPLDTWIQ